MMKCHEHCLIGFQPYRNRLLQIYLVYPRQICMTPEFTHTAHLKDCNMGAVTYQCAKILADSLVEKTAKNSK